MAEKSVKVRKRAVKVATRVRLAVCRASVCSRSVAPGWSRFSKSRSLSVSEKAGGGLSRSVFTFSISVIKAVSALGTLYLGVRSNSSWLIMSYLVLSITCVVISILLVS